MSKEEHPESSALSLLSPASLIQAAQKAHPAFKYATVSGGLCAIVAATHKFGPSPAILIFGVVILFCFMILFVIFARVAKMSNELLSLPANILVYTIILSVILLFTSAFWDYPLPFRTVIMRYCGATSPSIGFAKFGRLKADHTWDDQYLVVENAFTNPVPRTGDSVVTIYKGSEGLNIRSKAAGFSDKQITGILRIGDKRKVIDVKTYPISGGETEYWISFLNNL